ncbi:MAG: hypothetical protein AAGE89_02925 [Pseudomonadota bacterium]
MLQFLVSFSIFILFGNAAFSQSQDSTGNCSPNIYNNKGDVNIEYCITYDKKTKGDNLQDGNLVVNFSRLPARLNTASIMKLAEGAVFEFSPEWSSGGESKQYWITDGNRRFGLANDVLIKIWQGHQLNGKMPVGLPLWRAVSGNEDAIKALSLLAFIANLEERYDHHKMAPKYACYEIVLFDQFDCFCPGQIFERTAENTLNLKNLYSLCSIREHKLAEFYFTVMNIENKGPRPIKDIALTLRDSSTRRLGWITDPLGILRQCGLENQLDKPGLDIKRLHDCAHTYFNALADERSTNQDYATLEMSNLAPGKSIFLITNSYIPDAEGLPDKYIMGHLHVDKLSYFENGQRFLILEPTPRANKRIPVITSPDGGRGGQ